MTNFEAFILGFLQGASEFLPVSSSGHLVLGQALMGISLPGITFEVVVHVATLLSVLVVYRGRLLALARGTLLQRDSDALRYVGLLALATLPVAVIGLVFGDQIEAAFSRPATVGFALLFTGTILFSTRWALRRPLSPTVGMRAAIFIGLAQCVALIPGVSRSGSTVVTALWLGVAPVEAAAFSFLMSIPAIAGAAILVLPELFRGGGVVEAGAASGLEAAALESAAPGGTPLLVAFITAAVCGILAIRLFVLMLRNRSFPVFAWYCWGVGLLFLGWITWFSG